jgi:hypothetical protein
MEVSVHLYVSEALPAEKHFLHQLNEEYINLGKLINRPKLKNTNGLFESGVEYQTLYQIEA